MLALLVLIVTCGLCAYLVYMGIQGLRHSKDDQITVEGVVTKINYNSHSGFDATVEYQYMGVTRTTTVPTTITSLGGLKEGEVTKITVYKNSGDKYMSSGKSYFYIVFGSGVIIYIVSNLIINLIRFWN